MFNTDNKFGVTEQLDNGFSPIQNDISRSRTRAIQTIQRTEIMSRDTVPRVRT